MYKLLLLLTLATLSACAADLARNDAAVEEPTGRSTHRYESSRECKGCHAEFYLQYEDSGHFSAFEDPLFKGEYFKLVVPRTVRDPDFEAEAKRCIYCHAPAVYMNYTGLIRSPQQVAHLEGGVTCDFCHTLYGYAPNGDYRVNPSGKKQGPHNTGGSWHSEFSGFLQLSEFCGPCHDASNHAGQDAPSTYTEWRESEFARKKVMCQDCHMSKHGFLRDGKAEFASGASAHLSIGTEDGAENNQDTRVYDKLHNHRFPGAHSGSQLADAMRVELKPEQGGVDAAGLLRFRVLVDNSRTGHKMPSGSVHLRLMWLAVTASTDDGRPVAVRLLSAQENGGKDYAIAGATRDDATVIGRDIPAGSRIYRSVFVNKIGRQTLQPARSASAAFDNRLNPGEVRNEPYVAQLPPNYTGAITVTATLNYLAAPTLYTRKLGLSPFKPVQIATMRKKLPSPPVPRGRPTNTIPPP